jgi:hypothetical protein
MGRPRRRPWPSSRSRGPSEDRGGRLGPHYSPRLAGWARGTSPAPPCLPRAAAAWTTHGGRHAVAAAKLRGPCNLVGHNRSVLGRPTQDPSVLALSSSTARRPLTKVNLC